MARISAFARLKRKLAIELPSTRGRVSRFTPGPASTQQSCGPLASTSQPSAPAPGATQFFCPTTTKSPPATSTPVSIWPAFSAPDSSCQATPITRLPDMASASSSSRSADPGSAVSSATLCTPAATNGSGKSLRPTSSTTDSSSRKPRPRPPSASGTRMDVQPASAIARQMLSSKPGDASRSRRTRVGPPTSARKDFALSRKASAVVVVSVCMGPLREGGWSVVHVNGRRQRRSEEVRAVAPGTDRIASIWRWLRQEITARRWPV